ncbi:MAG: hypothetical protein ABL872_06065 [Lacibacter sp.]
MHQQKSSFILLTFLLFSSVCLFSCAQTKGLVKNMHAYYSEKTPGNIKADENGNPLPVKIDTVIVVYVETTTKLIAWDTAWKDNRMYKIIPQLIKPVPFEVGFEKGSKEKIFINADTNHFLYQLYLQPTGINIAPPRSIEVNQILLKAHYKGKTFLKVTGKLIEVDTYPSV